MKFIDISNKAFHELHYRSSGRGGKVRNVILPFYRATVDHLPEGVTSFVLTSDLQGRENQSTNRLVGEVVAEELMSLYELGEIPYINFITLAGDLYDHPEMHKVGGTGDVTSVWNAFSKYFAFVIGVHGNHDTINNSEMSSNTLVLDGTSSTVSGIGIGGVSGIMGRSERNQRKSPERYLSALAKVTKNKNSIVLLHSGPKDTINNQAGEPSIAEYLNSTGNGIVVFGHKHWSKPFITIGNHQILNVDKRVYIVSAAD